MSQVLREVSLNLLWSKTASNHWHVSAELLEGIHLTRFSEKIIGGMMHKIRPIEGKLKEIQAFC